MTATRLSYPLQRFFVLPVIVRHSPVQVFACGAGEPSRTLHHVVRRRIFVVDEDRPVPGDHMVGVEVVDGEVVDRGGRRAVGDGGDLDVGAGRGLQPGTGLEPTGGNPLLQGGDPEGVFVGRGDLVGGVAAGAVEVDRDVDEPLGALAGDEGGDGAGSGEAGCGVGGDHVIADIEV